MAKPDVLTQDKYIEAAAKEENYMIVVLDSFYGGSNLLSYVLGGKLRPLGIGASYSITGHSQPILNLYFDTVSVEKKVENIGEAGHAVPELFAEIAIARALTLPE